MREFLQRALLYGTAGLLAAGLGYAGFVYKAQPDPMTLLGGASLSIGLASVLPATDKSGGELTVRREQLERAEALLAQVEELHPGSSFTRERQAYIRYLQGRWVEAGELYREAAGLADVTVERRQWMLLNAAEMCREAGDGAGALAILMGIGEPAGATTRCNLLRGLVHLDAGDLGQARAALQRAVSAADGETQEVLECGELLVRLGDLDAAMAAVSRLQDDGSGRIAYANASLKLLAGDADSALAILERVPDTACDHIGQALRRDQQMWERFKADDRLGRFSSREMNVAAEPVR